MVKQRQQQVLGRHILVAEGGQLVVGAHQHVAQPLADRALDPTAADARQPGDLGAQLLCQSADRQAQLAKHLWHHAFALLEQRQQQVLRLDLAVGAALGKVLCRDQRFLGFLGKSIDIKRHILLRYLV